MTKEVINVNGKLFIRVNKAKALSTWKEGKEVITYPIKANVSYMWNVPYYMEKSESFAKQLEYLEASYPKEYGRYTKFFIES